MESNGGSENMSKNVEDRLNLNQTHGYEEPINKHHVQQEGFNNGSSNGGQDKEECSTPEVDYKRRSILQSSSVNELSRWKDSSVSPSPRARPGLDHSITAPVGTRRSLFNENREDTFSRSMTERRMIDLKFDRLSEREKKKLIVEMVKIQKDGTVEVDLTKSEPVTSEFLELHSVEGVPPSSDYIMRSTKDLNKSVPKLNIAVLVVGTRGDVQPFLAMARRLQEYGHRVRLATHANFRGFVKSAGVDFYPLGGDPRVLAGCKRSSTRI